MINFSKLCLQADNTSWMTMLKWSQANLKITLHALFCTKLHYWYSFPTCLITKKRWKLQCNPSCHGINPWAPLLHTSNTTQSPWSGTTDFFQGQVKSPVILHQVSKKLGNFFILMNGNLDKLGCLSSLSCAGVQRGFPVGEFTEKSECRHLFSGCTKHSIKTLQRREHNPQEQGQKWTRCWGVQWNAYSPFSNYGNEFQTKENKN